MGEIVKRTWGNYEVLYEEFGCKVKRLEVKINGSTSLQMHYHRAEYWVLVAGSAKVDLEDEEKLEAQIVRKGEVVVVEVGQKHRIENIGKIPLVIIEVQLGEMVNEDDIKRFD